MNRKYYSGLAVSVLIFLGWVVQPIFAASAKIHIHARVIHVSDSSQLLQKKSTVKALNSSQGSFQQTHVLSQAVVKVNVDLARNNGVRNVVVINH
ncbi:hypothetical protein BGC07_09670 [Piscirickettsia litoralis]|uniref:Uncharacterized protein n=2 Tax=Piscirickettsia litoralis TaxID=1891921 RepID=A0ABX3A6L6_9GAMM|nr:hypothetical protein BGC07_09670 [Piscirickettsia litoralis]